MSDSPGTLTHSPDGKLLPGARIRTNAKVSKARLLSTRIRKMLEEKYEGGEMLPFLVAAEIAANKEEKAADRQRSSEFLADRMFGKAMQPVELTGKRGGPVKTETKDTTPEKAQHERISEAIATISVLARHAQFPVAAGNGTGAGEDASGAGGGPRSA